MTNDDPTQDSHAAIAGLLDFMQHLRDAWVDLTRTLQDLNFEINVTQGSAIENSVGALMKEVMPQ